jgi:hypothetical protein
MVSLHGFIEGIAMKKISFGLKAKESPKKENT